MTHRGRPGTSKARGRLELVVAAVAAAVLAGGAGQAVAGGKTPSAPTGLTLTGVTTVNLTMAWKPVNRPGPSAVVGYGVYLGNTRVASVTGLQYAFGGLSCGTSYVLGVDAVTSRNVRSSIATVNASTSPCPDTSPPDMPTGLALTDAKQTAITLSWVAAKDNVGVAGYDLFKNGARVATTPGTSSTFAALACGKSYTLGVDSFDAAGNRSPLATVTASTSACPDTSAPTPPGNLQMSSATDSSLALSWTASADDTAVLGYGLYQNGVNVGTLPWLSYTFSGLACGTSYSLGVDSLDSAGNRSAIVSLNAATSACSAPNPVSTPPSNTASPIVVGQTTMGSTLDAGPGIWSGTSPMTYAYQWRRCDLAGASCVVIEGASAASYVPTLGDVGARLRVAVTATNVVGSGTASSALTMVVSNPTSDTSPPTAPTNLAKVDATATSVSVFWTASSDNVAVAGYSVYRDGTLLGSEAQTSYTVEGLSCGKSYSLGVEAMDAAGNVSPRISLTAATNPCSVVVPPPPSSAFPQGLWGEVDNMTDAELAQAKGMGFDTIFSNASVTDLDRAQAAGFKAIVWLGKFYDDNDTDGPVCTWQKTDAQITNLVNAVKGHPAVGYYFLDDEPHDLCPNVRQQFLDRNAVVKSLDSIHPTIVSENRTEAFDSLANVSDILIAIAYPCSFAGGCKTTNIPGRISALEAAGVKTYWAMRQTFTEKGTSPHYKYPTGSEYADQSIQWDSSRVSGELGFMGYGVWSGGDGIELAPQDLKDAVVARNSAR